MVDLREAGTVEVEAEGEHSRSPVEEEVAADRWELRGEKERERRNMEHLPNNIIRNILFVSQ